MSYADKNKFLLTKKICRELYKKEYCKTKLLLDENFRPAWLSKKERDRIRKRVIDAVKALEKYEVVKKIAPGKYKIVNIYQNELIRSSDINILHTYDRENILPMVMTIEKPYFEVETTVYCQERRDVLLRILSEDIKKLFSKYYKALSENGKDIKRLFNRMRKGDMPLPSHASPLSISYSGKILYGEGMLPLISIVVHASHRGDLAVVTCYSELMRRIRNIEEIIMKKGRLIPSVVKKVKTQLKKIKSQLTYEKLLKKERYQELSNNVRMIEREIERNIKRLI